MYEVMMADMGSGIDDYSFTACAMPVEAGINIFFASTMQMQSVEDISIPPTIESLEQLPASVAAECIQSNISANLGSHGCSDNSKYIWMSYFRQESSATLVALCFWRSFILDFSGEGRRSVDLIADRMAYVYKDLFDSIPSHHKDFFFSRYPDAVAQAVTFSLFLAFPKSRGLFNHNYRVRLLRRFHELINGRVPHQVPVSHWRLLLGAGDVLDTPNEDSAHTQPTEEQRCLQRFSPLIGKLAEKERFAALQYIRPSRMKLSIPHMWENPRKGRLNLDIPDSASSRSRYRSVDHASLERTISKDLARDSARLHERLNRISSEDATSFSELLIDH